MKDVENQEQDQFDEKLRALRMYADAPVHLTRAQISRHIQRDKSEIQAKDPFEKKVIALTEYVNAPLRLTEAEVARHTARELRESVSLYPKRMAEEVDGQLIRIEGLLSGKEEVIALDEESKARLLSEEDKLADKLEKIIALGGDAVLDINLDYFLTPAGQEMIASVLPWFANIIPQDRDGLRVFFYKYSYAFALLSKEERALLQASSHQYASTILEDTFTVDPDKGLQLNDAGIPEQMTVLLNPDQEARKVVALRDIRKEIKKEIKLIDAIPPEERSELGHARREIFTMYLRRVHELIVDEYPLVYYVATKESVLGAENISDEERKLLKFAKGKRNINRNLSRFDKFVYGAAQGINDKGNYTPLSSELSRFKNGIVKLKDLGRSSDEDLAKEKGLDIKKLREKNITAKQRQEWALRIFDAYGVEKMEGKDNGPWEYVIDRTRKSLIVTPRKRRVADKADSGDIISALSVAMNHEIEGHVLQEINRRKIPLRMFRSIKGDRYLAFSEAGAVDNEEHFVQDAFGLHRDQSYAYGAAMEAKLAGGGYLDSVKAFFDNRLLSLRVKYPDLSTDLAQQELARLKATAINATKRIFRDADISPFEPPSQDVRYSKDTLYMERQIIMEKLEAHGLRKLAFLGGMNLDNVATLIRLGMFDLSHVIEPKGEAMKIWHEIENQYKLEPTPDKNSAN